MILKLKYFGMIAEVIGKDEESFEFNNITIKELDTLLKSSYKNLNSMNYKIAVNQSIVDQDTMLNENDEIALLPPFAGG